MNSITSDQNPQLPAALGWLQWALLYTKEKRPEIAFKVIWRLSVPRSMKTH